MCSEGQVVKKTSALDVHLSSCILFDLEGVESGILVRVECVISVVF